jgi:hypothetical protein
MGLPDLEPKITLVDLINQRLPNGDWVPLLQRFEIQTASSTENGTGGARRVISRFHQVEAIPGRTGEGGIGASTMGYSVTLAPGDSLRGFRGWYTQAGKETELASEADFSRYQPDRLSPTGKPLFMLQGFHRRDFIRINRIEGLLHGPGGHGPAARRRSRSVPARQRRLCLVREDLSGLRGAGWEFRTGPCTAVRLASWRSPTSSAISSTAVRWRGAARPGCLGLRRSSEANAALTRSLTGRAAFSRSVRPGVTIRPRATWRVRVRENAAA